MLILGANNQILKGKNCLLIFSILMIKGDQLRITIQPLKENA